jgi:hypothetical protein
VVVWPGAQDTPMPEPVMEEIRKVKDISNVSQVRLLDMPDKVSDDRWLGSGGRGGRDRDLRQGSP